MTIGSPEKLQSSLGFSEHKWKNYRPTLRSKMNDGLKLFKENLKSHNYHI